MGAHRQNDISDLRNFGVNLGPRWESILKKIIGESSFSPNLESVKFVTWWNTEKVGSVSCLGEISVDGDLKPAVLKIQGSRPRTSEARNIEEFALQNTSKILRPPIVYKWFPWSEDMQFEAFIVEKLTSQYAIVNHPASDRELYRFFDLYEEYRARCRSKPWLKKPKGKFYYSKKVEGWMNSVKKDRKDDKYGEESDIDLAEKGISIIEKNLLLKDFEFAHGHISAGDFRIFSKTEVVLKSNLFWGWRNPFYDAVFGYQWWMLGMEHAKDLKDSIWQKEKERWLEKIYSLSEVSDHPNGEKLAGLALLERAIPALLIDRFMMDQAKYSASVITAAIRGELYRLVKEFS